MKRSFPAIQLVAILVTGLSVDCLPEHVEYTSSVIEYFDRSQSGTFKCIFMNLNKATQSDSDVDDLLKSIMSGKVDSYVIDGSFKATYGKVPVEPSLIVVNVGNQSIPKEWVEQVEDNFELFDTNSKVLVIGNLSNPNCLIDIARILAKFRFNLVVYLGIADLKVRRFDYNIKISAELYHFPDPKYLFEDAARDIQGNSFVYATMPSVHHDTAEWIEETAKFINGSAYRETIPCTDDRIGCIVDAIFAGAEIVTFLFSMTKYNADSYRWIFEKNPDSMVLMIPKGKPFNVLEMFLKPFTVEAWIALLILLCSMELVQFKWPTIFKNDPILLLVCGLERCSLHYANRRERLIFLPLILIFFLMSNAYESKLLSFMTQKPSHANFETLRQVLDSELKIKFNHFAIGSMAEDEDPLLAPLLVNNTDDVLYVDGIHAYLKDSYLAEGMVRQLINYDFNLRRPKYVVLKERLSIHIYAYWVEWKTPLRGMFYYTYQIFFESGLQGKWKQHSWDQQALTERFKYREQLLEINEEIMLGIKDLIPAWIALGIGLLLSGVAFIGEFLAKGCPAVFGKRRRCARSSSNRTTKNQV